MQVYDLAIHSNLHYSDKIIHLQSAYNIITFCIDE